ncbi:hypothetical protein PG994_013680 [Apiospora phragmitis]|uniref:Uncharacterized protein n=1 Tax=Apiospora phragmitis TaxID=2905665 RepID=A0ABR1T9C3_9PEZI
MDASLLTPELMASLGPYQCAFVKPDDDNIMEFPQTESLVLTEKELAHYDTPDTARYGGRDITQVFNDSHSNAHPMSPFGVGDAMGRTP